MATDSATATSGSPDPVLKPIEFSPLTYWVLVGVEIAFIVLLLGAGILTWNVVLLPFFNLGGIFVILALVIVINSWVDVKTNEWAAFYFFGRALKMAGSGPHFRVPFLMQLVRVLKRLEQFQAPGEPEDVYHGDEKSDLPRGKVWPIRVTSRQPRDGEDGHLDVQMTFEWSFYVQYQILDFFLFISRVGSFDQAKRLIRDSGEAILKAYAAERTLRGVIEDVATVDGTLDNRIRELANHWGMQIFEARTLAPNISHTLAEELRNLPVTRLKAEQMRTSASAERFRQEEEGAGAAKAKLDMLTSEAEGRKAFLQGEAEGLGAKMDRLKVSGETIVAAELASDAFANANAIMMGGGAAADLAATLQVTADALKKGGKNA